MFSPFKRLFSSPSAPDGRAASGGLQPESRYIVTVDEQRVICRQASGKEQTVTWDDLDAVIVETNDTGPLGIDVWWLLFDRGGSSGCAIPQGATGEGSLLRALQALPGFDHQSVIIAMSCTDNRRFLCWRRPAVPPRSSDGLGGKHVTPDA